jgi:hypothetical protein
MVEDGTMTEEVRESLTNFLCPSEKVDPEMMKYLFTGWYLYQEAERIKNLPRQEAEQ